MSEEHGASKPPAEPKRTGTPVPRQRPGKAARNERRKAAATTWNAASVALLVAALLQPMLAGGFDFLETVFAAFGFVVLQYALHYVLDRQED